tara:strand:+ start:89 stop:298 length:210 start_codon:yes stop_codon:yes gene_type:complete
MAKYYKITVDKIKTVEVLVKANNLKDAEKIAINGFIPENEWYTLEDRKVVCSDEVTEDSITNMLEYVIT